MSAARGADLEGGHGWARAHHGRGASRVGCGAVTLMNPHRFLRCVTNEVPQERAHGLDPRELGEGEVIVHHWSAPGGVGILTDRRCMLLGHPEPLHRAVEWSTMLDEVESIEVQELEPLRGIMNTTVALPQGVWGPTLAIPGDEVPGSFVVRVDGVLVFNGTPRHCEEVQGWIDAARAQRRPDLADQKLQRP
jgi:hypothetical protein